MAEATAEATVEVPAAGTAPATASADVTEAAAPQVAQSIRPWMSSLARGGMSPSPVSLGGCGTLVTLTGRMTAATEAATPARVVRRGGLGQPLLLPRLARHTPRRQGAASMTAALVLAALLAHVSPLVQPAHRDFVPLRLLGASPRRPGATSPAQSTRRLDAS